MLANQANGRSLRRFGYGSKSLEGMIRHRFRPLRMNRHGPYGVKSARPHGGYFLRIFP
ncbi:hypothetical protein [Bradyrhizobium iriomotense]|uniref:hypothetical protein n=1 Tax=Bradyrhizobium iriomotense TaxID=441950 RepID=UPI001B8A6D14|nr:hypothetical protein [Bradyrhizobium iriomotense]MBR1133927.1 hypothetical protein [Bradyrhizobium iriomotense]